jgi:choice-of-anchor B domain-containing protein
MKYYLVFVGLLFSQVLAAQNLQLRNNLSYGSDALANIGGYTDTLDNEYALVGTERGLDIVDVTDPDNPVIRFSVPGPTNTWREVKTYRKYAYVTTEGGGGLVVVDLSQLPANVNYQSYLGDGAISGQLNSIHALHCDTAMGFLYLYGSNIGDGNTLFLDLTDPWNPSYAGEYVYPGGGNDAYVHDGYVENDTMYEAHIYAGFFTVVDVTNKANPVLLATQTTPTAFTHNTWLSDDHKTLFTTDENNFSFLGAYDISDLQNIREISRFQTAAGSGSVVHNTHILNDYAVTSWYKEGVVIVDVSRPANPIEVGKYDTYAQGSGTGQVGCWGVYPFLPSGTIVASDMVNGLFVLTPTYIRGCYLEGLVSDSVTAVILPGATVQIIGTSATKVTNSSGEYKTGLLDSGLYDVEVSKPGYITKTITGVSLSNGVLTNLDVELSPIPTFAITGTILDSLSGLPLENASVLIENADFTFNATTDAAGEFTIPGVISGSYDIISGKWGHVSKCMTQNFGTATPIQMELTVGYYDDFTFDYNWTVNGSSSNSWERGVPIGSYDGGGTTINPEVDANDDCSNKCFVTDNGTGPYNNHDVDGGNTRLTSPIFDASIYVNPSLEYARWFVNNGGSGTPNDSMNIYLSNGTDVVLIESVTLNSSGIFTWYDSNFLISTFLTPTSTMQLIVNISDENPGHILEGGFDHFRISGQLNVGIQNYANDQSEAVRVYPNPFDHSTSIAYANLNAVQRNVLEVIDALGKIKETYVLADGNGEVKIAQNLSAGIYFVRIISSGGTSAPVRIVKQP